MWLAWAELEVGKQLETYPLASCCVVDFPIYRRRADESTTSAHVNLSMYICSS